MPDLKAFPPQGMLHEGWVAQVDDYALDCGWLCKGSYLVVADVAGGGATKHAVGSSGTGTRASQQPEN